MSAPPRQRHTGRERHLRLCAEAVWAQCPAEPQWTALPLAAGGCTLAAEQPRFRPDTFYGGFRRTVSLPHGPRVAGSLHTLLHPRRADLLLRMAARRTGDAPDSYTADLYTPVDPRRCTGAVVDRLELTRRTGDPDLAVQLHLVARAEEPRPTLSPEDFDYSDLAPVPFTWDDAAVLVDSEPLPGVEELALTVHNHLEPGPAAPGGIACLHAGHRDVRLRLTLPADSALLRDALRTARPVRFEMTLSHPAGHSLRLVLPAAHVVAAPDAAEPDAIAHATADLEAGTDESGSDLDWTVSLSE